MTVATVERAFGISSMTARRDLAILAQEGRLRRTHGGAVLPELASHEDSFRSRLEQEAEREAPHRLARSPASAEANETIFIDSSTTSYFAVEQLLELGVQRDAAHQLAARDEPGGVGRELEPQARRARRRVPPLTQSFVGAETVRAIEGFYADRCVFSVKGISAEGFLTDPDALEAEVKRAMISQAATVVLVATHRKFDGRGLNVIAPARRVQVAYLTDPPPRVGRARCWPRPASRSCRV